MSTENATIVTETETKKARKPSLPEKFGKFIQFGFHFMKSYNATAAPEAQLDEDAFIAALKIHATVDEQTAFVQSFFDSAKENKKELRKLVQLQIRSEAKADKPKAERKPRAKKTPVVTDADADADPAAAPKRGRKKATKVVNNTQDELINELVKRANSTDLTPVSDLTTVVDQAQVPPPVATKKPRAKKAALAETVAVADTVAVAPSKKSRAKKAPTDTAKTAPVKKPRAKKVPVAAPAPILETSPELVQEEEEGEEDELEVSVFEYNGKEYLIDANNVVYDRDSNDEIGTFDRSTNTLSLI